MAPVDAFAEEVGGTCSFRTGDLVRNVDLVTGLRDSVGGRHRDCRAISASVLAGQAVRRGVQASSCVCDLLLLPAAFVPLACSSGGRILVTAAIRGRRDDPAAEQADRVGRRGFRICNTRSTRS